MTDWDDLRFFLAVARAGSLAGAAKALGVNHSTVFRRIEGFEERLGARLFERKREGYALTVAGTEMLAAAERVDAEIDAAGRRATGRDARLTGPLTVTTTDDLMAHLLGGPLARFRAACPDVDLTVLLDSQFFNLSKRQADVAVRPTSAPPDILFGRRVGALAFAVYAAPPLAAGTSAPGAQAWLVPDDSLAHLAAAKWQKAAFPAARVAMRSNNLLALHAGAVAGMGLALLPCFIGDPDPGLMRIAGPVEEAASSLWLLTHWDLRNTRRVRAFMDEMGDALEERRDVLEGAAQGRKEA